MFAYCNCNPIRFSDPTGHAIWGTNTVAIREGGYSKGYYHISYSKSYANYNAYQTDIVSELAEKGIRYRIDESSQAGRVSISNSYMITDFSTMHDYATQLREIEPNAFSGSVNGFAFEWWLHSLLYLPCLSIGADDLRNKVETVDLGNTIYDDSHGKATSIMWYLYTLAFNEDAVQDLNTHLYGD